MKKFYFLAIFTFIFLSIFSQKLDKSVSFDEPEGFTKVLMLKNTNTFYVEFTKKEGINVMLFDGTRKKIVSEKLTLTLIEDKLGYYAINGIFEIAGDVAIFYQKAEDKIPIMIRIVIDGKTGKVKSEEKIAELNKMTTADAYAYAYGDTDMPAFDVAKDPESDFYALVRYNTFAKETKDRIEVLHFGPTHKIINKANYESPNGKYKYTKYLSVYVHKDDYVLLGTYAFNTQKSGGDEARFYVAQLAKGKSTFLQKELSYFDFYKGARCTFIYNNVKNCINMVLITDAKVEGGDFNYDIVFQSINPTTLQLDKPFKADFSKVNEMYKSQLNKKSDFAGMVQGVFVDKNGNLTVMYQNTALKYGNGSGITGTFLGDVAVITMSPEGKHVKSAVFPLDIYVSGKHASFNSNSIRNGLKSADIWQDPGLANYQYFALDFVATDNAEYLLFNNVPENIEAQGSEKQKMVKAISLTTAVKYTLNKDQVKKEYLIAKPNEKKDNDFCNFGCSDFNSVTKTYATLVTDPKVKKTSLVWFKID